MKCKIIISNFVHSFPKFGMADDLTLAGNWKHVMPIHCKGWLIGTAVSPSHMHVHDNGAADVLCSSHLMKGSARGAEQACLSAHSASVPFRQIDGERQRASLMFGRYPHLTVAKLLN
jgi:hypothetical protein